MILGVLSGSSIPEISERHAILFWQEKQKVLFTFHAQEIHIKTGLKLVCHVTKNVKVRD